MSINERLLFVLHEMGTLDHAVALKAQLGAAGATVHHVVLGEAKMPSWAISHFPEKEALTEEQAWTQLGAFRAAWVAEPYESLRPTAWRQLWNKIPLVYSGYGVNLTAWKEGHYELDFYSHCEIILVSSHLDMEGHLAAGRDPEKLVLAGDPLLFEIATGLPQEVPGRESATVLWAPHWAKVWDGGPGFSNWEWTVGALYRFFRSRPSQRLVVRPHPFLDFEKGGLLARRKARALLALPNVSVSVASMREDIEAADILVSDGVTILAYFGVTGKPVVFLRKLGKRPPFNSAGFDLTSAAQTSTTPVELVNALSMLSDSNLGSVGTQPSPMRDVVLDRFLLPKTPPGATLLSRLQAGFKGSTIS